MNGNIHNPPCSELVEEQKRVDKLEKSLDRIEEMTTAIVVNKLKEKQWPQSVKEKVNGNNNNNGSFIDSIIVKKIEVILCIIILLLIILGG